MKTQFKTITGYRMALLLILLVGLLSCPIYAVSNDKHLFFSVSDLLQDTKQKPTIKLTGTVKDSFGALGGVIVTIGTKVITTDLDGKYTINITSGDKITFSMMGYKDQSIVYTGGSSLNITLSEDNNTLDEIVVNAGYYTVKDRERTGSIARVTAKDIELQPVSNPLQALQGRMPGVDITQQSGIPGGGTLVEIRGQNFFGTSKSNRNNPLYIIDGVPFLSNTINSSLSQTVLADGISPLNAINPKDIENIEILKDADATAIYGSRGANGVVLITTKKGKSDKTRFTLSSTTSLSKVANFIKLLDTPKYLQIREEAFANSGITELPINAFDLNGAWEKNRYTNWQKELIGDTAIDQNTSLGINAGNEYSNFNVNYTHNTATTVFPTDKGYKRNSILLNYNYKSKDDRLLFTTSTTYSDQNNNLLSVDFTKQALTLAPNAPSLFDNNGDLNWQNGTFDNPLAELNRTYESKTETLILNGLFSYNILPNIYLKLNTGYTSNNLNEWLLTPHTVYSPLFEYTSEYSEAANVLNQSNSFIIEPQINIIKQWKKNSFNLLLGSTFQANKSQEQNLRGVNYNTNTSLKNIGTAKEKYIGSNLNQQYKYASIFARLNYTYNSKYILNLTARRDGSSRFGKNNRFGNFGAVGAAWIFTKEGFTTDLKWLDFGKIRSSYGITGSDNIGDYAYLDTYTISLAKYDNETGLYPTALYNPNYKWEKTKKFEVALELELFKSSINPTIAYYNNTSTDQLIGLTLPSTTGFSSITTNSPAVVRNTGWEFTINTSNINHKDWSWSTNFNISFPQNKLVSYPGLENSTQTTNYVVGKPIKLVKTYKYEGTDPLTGYFIFKDYNQDGIINYQDQKYTKYLNTKFHGGMQNSISYKNVVLDFLFYFKKQDNYNINKLYSIAGAYPINMPVELLDRWSTTNPNGQYPASSINDPIAFGQITPFKNSDATISDASYIRLKNVSLSYTLKLPKAKIESLRLYLQGQNLWTITSYKGMDPEFTTYGYTPPLRTYSFGMQLTF